MYRELVYVMYKPQTQVSALNAFSNARKNQ
jgi:hypothetical protein